VSEAVLEALKTATPGDFARRRFRGSQMALMMDDLRALEGGRNKLAYLAEFLFPPGDYLLERYEKRGKSWLPVLYLRYVLGGVLEKIALR
jgi:hypothetical protein